MYQLLLTMNQCVIPRAYSGNFVSHTQVKTEHHHQQQNKQQAITYSSNNKNEEEEQEQEEQVSK